MVAGRAVGQWDLSRKISMQETVFLPSISPEERNERYQKWQMAVERSLGWDIWISSKRCVWANSAECNVYKIWFRWY